MPAASTELWARESASNTKTYDTINPFTEEKIKTWELMSEEEAIECIEKSHEAFLDWSKRPIEERAKVVRRFGQLLKENKDELAQLMTDEMGKRKVEGEGEVDKVSGLVEYCADKGPEFLKDEEKEIEGGKGYISYRPEGVVFGIQPWNFPLYQAVRYSAATILAGNTTVFKHASSCFGMACKLEELWKEAGAPEGVFTSLIIESELSEKLMEHEYIIGVSFTGSGATGSKVAEKAGKELKKTVLELGGSDPYIVMEDADIDRAAKTLVQGRIRNAGQVCLSAKRFIVLEGVYDEFKKKVVAQMKEAQMGDPNEKTTKLAPIARKDLLEKVNKQVEESLDKGATCLLGGNIAERKGYFFQPTVLEDIKPGMPAYDDEIFGPVVLLFKAKDIDQAVKIANDTRFGLGGGIFSSDIENAKIIARDRINSGMVTINGICDAEASLPFGGVKGSGYGREHARFGFKEFVNIKAVRVKN